MAATRLSSEHASGLLENCIIDALIPLTQDVSFNTLLNEVQSASAEGDTKSLATRVPQKETIFFDEKLLTCVVLQCPLLQQELLKEFLSRLIITLEAYAVGTRQDIEAQDAQKASAKELVDSHTLESTDDPVVAVGADDDGEDQHDQKRIYVLWKQELHVARAQIRSHNPSLYLSCAAKIRPFSTIQDSNDEYLTAFQPESVNLFYSLQYDPSFKGKKPPILSAARLSKHTPAGAAVKEQARPLKNLTRTLHKLIPAVTTRLKCTRLGGGAGKATRPTRILACIEAEIDSVFPVDEMTMEVQRIDVSLEDGEAVPIPSASLPITTRAGDLISFVYDLSLDHNTTSLRNSSGDSSRRHTLDLEFSGRVVARHEDITESRQIFTKWRTSLDLAPLYALVKPPSVTASPEQSSAQPLLIAVESATGLTRHADTILWTIAVTNTTSVPARPIRAKIEQLIGNESTTLVALKPYITTHMLAPSSSTTMRLEFRILGQGLVSPGRLRVTEVDEKGLEKEGSACEVAAPLLPDAIALE